VFISKWIVTGNQRSYQFHITPSGLLNLFLSSDGISNVNANSSVGTAFVDGSTHWVRVTFDQSSGDVVFYTSEDGVTWLQLGTTQNVNITSIFDSTSEVGVGARDSGTLNVLSGEVFKAEILNGIDGPVAVSFDADDFKFSFPMTSVATGELWTANGNADIIRDKGLTTSTGLPVLNWASATDAGVGVHRDNLDVFDITDGATDFNSCVFSPDGDNLYLQKS